MSGPTFIKTQSEIGGLLARSFFYQLLALLFRHPQASEVQPYFQESKKTWKQMLPLLNISDNERLTNLLSSLFGEILKNREKDWTVQYEHCFGYTAYAKVPAYELEYGEEHSHRQPQELADIAAFYRAFGLQVTEKSHERVDHVTVECEFMYFLLYKEAYAFQYAGEEKAVVCREGSRRFLQDHLGRWLPSFALRLSKHSSQGLMKDAADFALEFVIRDSKSIGVKGGPLDLPVRAIQEIEESGCVSCSLGSILERSGRGKS